MKRILKALGLIGAITVVFGVAVAGASASTFGASEAGSLTGVSLTSQVFTTSVGEIKCTSALTSGSAVQGEVEEQKVTTSFSGCSIFGIGVTVSPAELKLKASGKVDLLNTITFSVAFPKCTLTVAPQSGLGAVGYKNNSGRLVVESALTGIVYSGTGGLCPTGTTGTFTGKSELKLNGGAGAVGFIAGTIRPEIFLNGVKVKECKFEAVKDVCKIQLTVEGEKEDEWRIDKNGWEGKAKPEERYKLTVGCTPKNILEPGGAKHVCTDEIEATKLEANSENKWCIYHTFIGGPLKETPICTKLTM